MDNVLELYQKILYGNLCPWTKEPNDLQKYQQLLFDMDEEIWHIPPLYELHFIKSVLPKRKYYAVLIEHEARRFLNQLHQKMAAAFNEHVRSYHIRAILGTIEQQLKRTALLICSKGFPIDIILRPNVHLPIQEPGLSDSTYILHFLKYQLICLYLEVQDRYTQYIDRDILNEEDVHQMYFQEAAPLPSFIAKVSHIMILPEMVPAVSLVEEEFQPIMHDTRMQVHNVLPYEEIVADKMRFARLERELFKYGLIDKAHQFQRTPRGNVSKMAAVYLVSFQNGYYYRQYFKGKKRVELTAKEVQVFLNHRYNAHIDRLFRILKEEDKLEAYIEDVPWITLIDQF